MHPNHSEQGTMIVLTLPTATLAALLDRLDGATEARIAVEVAPQPPMSGDEYLGDLKVSPNGGMWSLPLGNVSTRITYLYDTAGA